MASISVAMCTFNGERYLDAQLASLAQQTLKPSELIVCDDGSSDDTQSLVSRFAASAPFPVRWIRNPSRLGYRRNFITAANLCAGDLIAFCDQDDIWSAEKLERSAIPFVNPDVMLTYHRVSLIDQDGNKLGHYDDRAPKTNPVEYPDCDPWLFGLGFTLTFRGQLRLHADLWPLSKDFYDSQKPLAHDQWFFFLALAFGKVVYIEEALALYRQHGLNLFGAGTDIDLGSQSYEERMRHRHAKNVSYADACDSNALILTKIVDSVDRSQFENIQKMIDKYGVLSEMFNLSANLAEKYSIPKKLYDVWRLHALGSYRRGEPWSFEQRDPVRDLITCLASGRAKDRIERS